MQSSTIYHSDIVVNQWQELKHFLKNPSEKVKLDGDNLTLAQSIFIARYGGRALIRDTAHAALADSSNALRERLEQGEVIYGVNTGFGANAHLRSTDMERLQTTLMRELNYGILAPGSRDHDTGSLSRSLSATAYDLTIDVPQDRYHIPWTWVRAALLVRINSLVNGHSAVRPVIVERLMDLLNNDITPMIPLRGSISASGDLNPLSYFAQTVQGKSSIRILTRDGTDLYANDALAAKQLEPVSLQAKEGLAIVNGTAVSTAAGLSVLYDAHGLAVLAQMLSAMSVEGLMGTTESFHPFFGFTRPHPGQVESANNILKFLQGSRLAVRNDGTDGSLRQDRYSIRTVPQWIGPALEDLVLAHQQISIECNSTTDNPLFDENGNALHGGNFQAKSVTSAMEKTRQAVQAIGRMLFMQCNEMINPTTSRGLPANLVAEDGINSSIFKGVDIQIAALLSELGFLAAPVNSVQTAEGGNQSLNSLALISARYTHNSVEVLSELMAAHLLAACQAVDLRALHIDFLENYRPEFFTLMSGVLSRHFTDFKISVETVQGILWKNFVKLFDSTANLAAEDRCNSIAESMRIAFMDLATVGIVSEPLAAMEDLRQSLSASLQTTWPPHRDAYMDHGDATQYLGFASKRLYHFVRRELNIPFLSTSRIMPPELAGARVTEGVRAPTVGQYTGVIYRAIRDGSMTTAMLDIMTDAPEADQAPAFDTVQSAIPNPRARLHKL